jgi:mannosyltransferase
MQQNGVSLSSAHRSKDMFGKETEFLQETRFLLVRASLSSAHRTGAWIGQRSLLLAGILLGFALRLFHLGAESLWYDETVSVHLARQSALTMLAHTAGDIHPPGYYLLLHAWQQIASPTLAYGLEFLYAWPSLVAGVLLLALTYVLGRRLFNARTGLVALWLAAFNPFQLWYSQEVRMYTVGAALALLTLWAALRVLDRSRPRVWLVVYAVSAAAGLYTLYYFAFWLVAVNTVMFALLWRAGGRRRAARLGAWLAAQIGALALFAPWLPIMVRQVLEPPVPPWRAPWATIADFFASLAETLGSLLVGQSPPAQINWPWALFVAVVIITFIVWAWRNAARSQRESAAVLLTITVLPIAQLYTVTWLATPIYHVRYIFLYAPAFLLMPAALIAAAWPNRRLLAGSVLMLWLGVSVAAITNFWTNPLYRADDHRRAVAALAADWRPGDAILANAGWIYPVLTTYWPEQVVGVNGAVPFKLVDLQSIDDYTKNNAPSPDQFKHPQITRSGSIDGPATLGWGNPASDFFAASTEATTTALATIAGAARRIWHYRLYDTVSDPTGVIRQWLNEHATLLQEMPIPGRDFGMMQLYATRNAPDDVTLTSPICFDDMLCLYDYAQVGDSATAGTFFYLAQTWRAVQSLPDLSVSLRLYDAAGRLAAQADAPFVPATSTWEVGAPQRQAWALPIGVSTKPGAYMLAMVVYRQTDGGALSLPADAPSADGQQLSLGTVTVLPADAVPELPPPLATFDYIELLTAQLDRTTARPGEALRATVYWRPRTNAYRDTYHAVVTLQDQQGAHAGEWRFTLGGDAYPSGAWPENLPVRDLYDVTIPATATDGDYTLTVAVERASDGALIAARQSWSTLAAVAIGDVRIEAP